MGNSGLGYYADDMSRNGGSEREAKDDPTNAAATSSYYHFDSNGKKFMLHFF